jgi:hypothetical protein
MMAQRRRIFALAVVVLLLAASACSDGGDDEATTTTMDERLESLAGAGVFIGGVAMTNTLVAIHFEGHDRPSPMMRMYVSDGAPGGAAEWFEGRADGNRFRFTSASGRATIEGEIQRLETDGMVTFADGTRRVFFTRPAGHGAGIFEVTVDGAGMWTGRSLDGSTLEADQTGPTVDGFVRAATGEMFRFRHNDITRRLGYSRQGGQADNYTLIITRQATEMVGRGGNVRGGRPSDNIIALDLAASEPPTPGIYYGRVAMTTDKLAFDINDLPDGRRQLRAYVSDAEPEPEGDIEWFTSPITGNTFTITSASRNARIEGSIAADGVSGMLTLPDQPARRYFAGPAGEGAGIYDVTVQQDRGHTGTSEEGGKLELIYKDGMVSGKVTAPNGRAVDLLGADLTHAYRLGVEGSLPGTYVAFAAPRGRFLIGRNGDVRGGSSGVNIIGLDKKC